MNTIASVVEATNKHIYAKKRARIRHEEMRCEHWSRAYCAAIEKGHLPEHCKFWANQALQHYDEAFPEGCQGDEIAK